jgi:hypothetical protein
MAEIAAVGLHVAREMVAQAPILHPTECRPPLALAPGELSHPRKSLNGRMDGDLLKCMLRQDVDPGDGGCRDGLATSNLGVRGGGRGSSCWGGGEAANMSQAPS